MIGRLVVDGYNVVHAWPELAALMRGHDLEEARRRLVALLAEHHASTGVDVIVVFDSAVPARQATAPQVIDGVEVRFGWSGNSADHVIERLCYESARAGVADRTVVVTNDRLQRDMVGAMGVAAMGVDGLRAELERSPGERKGRSGPAPGAPAAHRLEDRIDPQVRERLERMRRGGQDQEPGTG